MLCATSFSLTGVPQFTVVFLLLLLHGSLIYILLTGACTPSQKVIEIFLMSVVFIKKLFFIIFVCLYIYFIFNILLICIFNLLIFYLIFNIPTPKGVGNTSFLSTITLFNSYRVYYYSIFCVFYAYRIL